MLHRRVQSAKLPRLLLTVIGLSLLGIACQNPLQAPPTFQDKFNKIELASNETNGMTVSQVREIFGGPGRIIPYLPAEKLSIINDPRNTFFNSVNIEFLSRYRWAERPAAITVVFFRGNAIIKTFTTS